MNHLHRRINIHQDEIQDKDGLIKTLERMLEPNQQDIQGLPASTVQYSTGKDFFLIF